MGNFCTSSLKRHDARPVSPLHASSLWGLCAGSFGELLTCSEDKTVGVFDLDSKSLNRQWYGHDRGVNRVAYLPSASLAASGSRDTTVRLWKSAASEAVAVLSAHNLPVTGLAPIDHHNQICSGSRDCTLRLWDVATGSEVACSKLPQNFVTFMKAVPAESAVLQCGEDLQLRVWDTRVMQPVQMLSQHDNIPLCCDVSPDGMHFATSCNGFDREGCEVCVWDRRQLRQIWQCKGHQQATKAVVFLPAASRCSSNYTCTTDQEHDITAAAGAAAAPPGLLCPQPDNCSNCLPETMSGMMLASASADGIKVWEVGQGQPIGCMTSFAGQEEAMVTCLAVCSASHHKAQTGNAETVLFAGNFCGQLQSWDVQQLGSHQTS